MLGAGRLCAQEAIQQPEPSTPDYTPLSPRETEILQSGPTNSTGSATETLAPPAAEVPAPTPSPQSGTLTQTPRRFQYNLSFTERIVFDDNIAISHFNRMSDIYFSLEPTLSLGFGVAESFNFFSLTYHPTVSLFVDHTGQDAVQHIIRLQGGRNFGHLSLSLSQDIQILNGADLTTLNDQTGHNANIDVGTRSRHDVFTTALNGSYQLTGKLFLTSGSTFVADEYDGPQIGSKNVSGNLYLNYQYREKLVVGVGGTGGYNTVDSGSPDQVFEQANVRVGYTATAKTSVSATAGFEFREFQNGSRGLYVSPVYSLNLSYAPSSGTTFSLIGSRQTSNSASLAGQDYTTTQVSGAIHQLFLQRCLLGLSVGYDKADYFSTINGISVNRTDEYYFVEPSVDVTITRFWTAGAYYLHRQNTSSLDPFSFYDNQVGFRTVLTF